MMKTTKSVFISHLKQEEGFTLIEILVALFLVIVVIALVAGGLGSINPRKELESTVDELQRAIRFSRDEAILRGRITRLYIAIDETPQSFRVEYGPDEKFVLPKFITTDPDKLTIREKEENSKKVKRLNQSFTPMEEFQESSVEINENTVIKAIGTTLTNTVHSSGNISLFFYPSGEKDGALLLIAGIEDMASLAYEPFTNDIEENYYEIETDAEDEDLLNEYFIGKAKELFEQWNKN